MTNKSNKKDGGRKAPNIEGIVGCVRVSRAIYLKSLCHNPNVGLAARMSTIIHINGAEAVNHG